jgi:hypothetical protein
MYNSAARIIRTAYEKAEWEQACKSGGAAMLAHLKQRQQQMYPDLRTLTETSANQNLGRTKARRRVASSVSRAQHNDSARGSAIPKYRRPCQAARSDLGEPGVIKTDGRTWEEASTVSRWYGIFSATPSTLGSAIAYQIRGRLGPGSKTRCGYVRR